ncbi:hypothetical protein JIG36_13195 [Actinoplanes sp. LDG1-06]|uniref:Uncharacterized protein n=1 Tax=Paractinoplanes ovalisporus TaxID=2810368 RepID=A0ABS2A9J9_9ACTN|nr:hypothetical protein [Actinoplanes ovalisporus]MBM2616513.1 hypothetical protein [Actinoplanes ovalisporus]
MDDQILAYSTGRADGIAGRRDHLRAGHPGTGADYRMGFLDGRIEVFHMLTAVRRMVDDADEGPHR